MDVVADAQQAAPQEPQLAGQTYEIIRNRLSQHGQELRARLGRLNDERKDVFGSIETELIGTERITTDNNCLPRDMVAVGGRFLFGYNVHVGLRSETKLSDVFAVYRYEGRTFHAEPLELVGNKQFESDFRELYTYYKNTVFAKFAVIEPYLFMVFRVGKSVEDVKTFKWMVEGERLSALKYIDNRSDYEYRFPLQHEFEWRRTTRDMQHAGRHPHISIKDRVFVETVGGDLTIKIENNTESGEGIYAEPVENPDQTLDDAEIYYAVLGNLILLKIRPYQENDYRYIVYNQKVQQAKRIDAISESCVLLPDDHGIIFPKGYYLQSGEYKTFETNVGDMVFEKRIQSPNGEDYLYVFFNRLDGVYVLLSYNVISQVVGTPTICNGYAFFESGELLTFRHQHEPQKHHAVQIWQTPYTGQDFRPATSTDSFLYKIGNKDLVRAMAECHEVLNLIAKEDSYANLYIDIVKKTTDVIDSYFWIADTAAQNLAEVLTGIRDAAQAATAEFEKVIRVKKNTEGEVTRVTKRTEALVSSIKASSFESIDDFVHLLAELRTVRGEIISLKDLKYVDVSHVDKLEGHIREYSDRLAQACVEFLLQENALAPYEKRVAEADARIGGLAKVADAKLVGEEVEAAAGELEMLIEIVSNLKIEDATHRTAIIDNISAIFARLNKTRATLKNKIQDLASVEGAAEFSSQLKLIDQAVVNYLDVCDTPPKCEEYLTKLMIQVEELEGRFGEFDDMVEQIGEKREEIYNAFEAKRLALVEGRNRRAHTLMKSAERILSGIRTRVESLASVDEIHGYFAGDLMVDKVRDVVRQLGELGDSVKVGDVQSRLKTVREDAVRQLKDKKELYVDGQSIIQFGKHKFGVNTQPLDLTTVLHEDAMCYHLTGTNFFEPIADETFLATRPVWDQEVISENRDVYRGESLAWQMLQAAKDREDDSVPPPADLAAMDEAPLTGVVQKFMAPRYAEGYLKGVHDHDGAKILHALARLTTSVGLLRYGSAARALAWLFWKTWDNKDRKPVLAARLRGFGRITSLFPETTQQEECIDELQRHVAGFIQAHGELDASLTAEAGEYLFHALSGEESFVIAGDGERLVHEFRSYLASKAYDDDFANSLAALKGNTINQFLLARDWVEAYLDEHESDDDTRAFRDEAAQLLVEGEFDESRVVRTSLAKDLEGVAGNHARIAGGRLRVSMNEFTARLTRYEQEVVPVFKQYQHLKHVLVERAREELRLEEFRPRVLTSFVRNRLIDRVYLPLIGANLAKQLGTAGEETRTDRSGLLLVISPPGYGKTTLMEYIANRLGIIFMKINGPAIGHRVTSLDPAEAPNAAAREEMEKLNLSLEMGDNVMIYVDDIQHVNPEFLQKFISLCDATRKIEGVWKGRTRTYDLRGKKVCVVMAGNPYTESGELFKIPDMLANRADTYNLGEIIGETREWFEMSLLENCLTSNPTLAPLASRHYEDVYGLIKMAETDSKDPVDLAGNYSLDELGEYVNVMKKLILVRDVVLAVNEQYIKSAAQADEYRTEPPFKLQGSYRNMNRIAERVSPLMNDEELKTLVLSQYEQDAGTLTTGTEANLLKFKELAGRGWLSDTEAKRWESIKQTFRQNLKLRGIDTSDRFGQVVAQMSVFGDGLNAIREAVVGGVERLVSNELNAAQAAASASQSERIASTLGDFRTGLEALRDTLAGGLSKLESLAKTPDGNGRPVEATFAPEAMELLTKFIAELQMATSQRPVGPADPALGATGGRVPAAGTNYGPPEGDEGQAAATLVPASTSPAQPYRVEVINRVPRVFLSIIREQFRLMQQWMEPLTKMSQQNRAELDALQKQLKEATQRYDDLMGDLEE